MYFDFGDGHPDLDRLPPALSLREGVLLAIIVHLLLVITALVFPELPWVRAMTARAEAAREQQRPVPQESQRFVFVQPRVDVESLRPRPRVPLSDMNREATTAERAPDAANRQPRSRGNTSEYVERTPPAAEGRGARAAPPSESTRQAETDGPQDPATLRLPDGDTVAAYDRRAAGAPTTPAGGGLGSLRQALENIERYTERAQFDNPEGGAGAYGPWIQFDSKGVEFGPWIRRFVAQVKRYWFVPMAAMSLKGHVVITFNVHRNGALTDLTVVGPSSIDAFNNAAFNALVRTNPTQPLPDAYPDDKAFFTVTFFYNESPPPAP
jgi:TonB family protein